MSNATEGDYMLDDKLDEILSKHLQDIRAGHDSKLREAISALIDKARIEELEQLKQWNSAFIGMDGKRVDNMVSHQIIDEHIAKLTKEKGQSDE